jgi:predicted GNAT family acetyltransferase
VNTPGVTVADVPERGQFEIAVADEPAGFAVYQRLGHTLAFTHTEIDDRFEGQGLGGRLISFSLDAAREAELEVLPYCPFVRAYIARHPEYLDLVPARRRAEFELAAPGDQNSEA